MWEQLAGCTLKRVGGENHAHFNRDRLNERTPHAHTCAVQKMYGKPGSSVNVRGNIESDID